MKSSTNHLVPLIKSHQLLEQNEDTIASIVENLQLGRLDNCLVQYSSLLSNLISLSLEFDNYPAEDEHEEFSDIVCKFPDALMRKDLLDDMRPPDVMYTPDPPLVAPCLQCVSEKKTSFQCRVEAGHVAPHNKFTSAELKEFLCATEVVALQHGEYNVDKLKSKNKTKKMYKRWNAMEKYTVMLAIARTGSKEIAKLLPCVKNRTDNQLRSFINKNFTVTQLEDLQKGIIPPPPPKYQPPESLNNSFPTQYGDTLNGSGEVSKLGPIDSSTLAPVENGGEGSWNSLLRQAAAKWTGDTTVVPKIDSTDVLPKNAPPTATNIALPIITPTSAANVELSQINSNQNFDPNIGIPIETNNNYYQQYQPQQHQQQQQYSTDGVYNAYLPQFDAYGSGGYTNGSYYPYDTSQQQQHQHQQFLQHQQEMSYPYHQQQQQLQEQPKSRAASSSTKRGRAGTKSTNGAINTTTTGVTTTGIAGGGSVTTSSKLSGQLSTIQQRERAQADAEALAAQNEMIMRAVATGTVSGDSYEHFLQAISADQVGTADDVAASYNFTDLFPSQPPQLFMSSNAASSDNTRTLNLFSSISGNTNHSENQSWSNTSGVGVGMVHGANGDYMDEEGRLYYYPPPEDENSLLMFGS